MENLFRRPENLVSLEVCWMSGLMIGPLIDAAQRKKLALLSRSFVYLLWFCSATENSCPLDCVSSQAGNSGYHIESVMS